MNRESESEAMGVLGETPDSPTTSHARVAQRKSVGILAEGRRFNSSPALHGFVVSMQHSGLLNRLGAGSSPAEPTRHSVG